MGSKKSNDLQFWNGGSIYYEISFFGPAQLFIVSESNYLPYAAKGAFHVTVSNWRLTVTSKARAKLLYVCIWTIVIGDFGRSWAGYWLLAPTSALGSVGAVQTTMLIFSETTMCIFSPIIHEINASVHFKMKPLSLSKQSEAPKTSVVCISKNFRTSISLMLKDRYFYIFIKPKEQEYHIFFRKGKFY